MRGFLSLEMLVLLLTLTSLFFPLGDVLISRGKGLADMTRKVLLARSALTEVRNIVERAVVDGSASGAVTFPPGTLRVGDGISLEVNGETFYAPSPAPLEGGSFEVEGEMNVQASWVGGKIRVVVS